MRRLWRFLGPAVAFLALQGLLLLRGCLGEGEEGAGVAPMEERERTALYAAIESFVGKEWNGSGLYPDPCGWSPIQGVSCDLFNGLWYPTVINIGPVLDNSLQCAPDAKFSPQIFDLRHLKSLSFYNCFTVHNPTTIPATNWERLSGSLETLEFRTNPGLSGPIPALLGRLSSLQSLVLAETNLSGALPAELGALSKLRRLVVSGNRLSGRVPAVLGGLSGLLKMDLSNNFLEGSIPPELGRLKNLTLLDLRNNSFTGGLAKFMQEMVSLQDLLLSDNPLGGSLMQFGWEKLVNLATLDMSNLGLVGTIPESMAALTRLRFLALDHNHLTGNVPAELGALPSLGALYLNGNNLTGRLEFSQGFYQRMGRRFASWDNPSLCYNGVAVDVAHAPFGVPVCKGLQEASVGVRDKVDARKPEESSSFLAASFGFSASRVTGFWYVVLVQEVVATVLLMMFL